MHESSQSVSDSVLTIIFYDNFMTMLHIKLLFFCLHRDRWHTPIHEVRDMCEKQLIEFKKDIAGLEEQRRKYKFLPTEDKVPLENEENSEDEKLATEQSDENASCTDKNVSIEVGF